MTGLSFSIYLSPRNTPNNPTTPAIMPPTNNHMALLVGEPVSACDTSELAESKAHWGSVF